MKWFKQQEVVALLEREIEKAGSQQAFAEKVGLSAQYICDVLRSRRIPGPRLSRAVGLEMVQRWRKLRI